MLIDSILFQMHFLFAILLFGFCLSTPLTGSKDAMLFELRKDLFHPSRYDKSNSPNAQNPDTHFTIHMKLYLFHVYKINEAAGVLSINGFFHASWTDKRLKWQPSNYGDVSEIFVPQHVPWIPHLLLINDAAMKKQNKYGANQMLINNNGSVYLAAPTTILCSCELDHKYYPFDKHICAVEYEMWTMEAGLSMQIMDGHHEKDILEHFSLENPEWKIFYRKDRIVNRTFVCCPQQHLEFYRLEFGVERRAQFFTFFLVTPSSLCVLITLSLFWIPIEQHGYLKISLAGLVIFMLVTLLSFLSWTIPSGGTTTPRIVLFCGNSLIMASVSIVATIASLKISRRSHKPIPPIVENVTKIILGNCKKNDLHVESGPSGWVPVVAAFDRICFIIYVGAFIYLAYNSFKYT